jgi:hypothetical protein
MTTDHQARLEALLEYVREYNRLNYRRPERMAAAKKANARSNCRKTLGWHWIRENQPLVAAEIDAEAKRRYP